MPAHIKLSEFTATRRYTKDLGEYMDAESLGFDLPVPGWIYGPTVGDYPWHIIDNGDGTCEVCLWGDGFGGTLADCEAELWHACMQECPDLMEPVAFRNGMKESTK